MSNVVTTNQIHRQRSDINQQQPQATIYPLTTSSCTNQCNHQSINIVKSSANCNQHQFKLNNGNNSPDCSTSIPRPILEDLNANCKRLNNDLANCSIARASALAAPSTSSGTATNRQVNACNQCVINNRPCDSTQIPVIGYPQHTSNNYSSCRPTGNIHDTNRRGLKRPNDDQLTTGQRVAVVFSSDDHTGKVLYQQQLQNPLVNSNLHPTSTSKQQDPGNQQQQKAASNQHQSHKRLHNGEDKTSSHNNQGNGDNNNQDKEEGEGHREEEEEGEEEDEEEEGDLSSFDYEPVLIKILNEKKLALANSPDVIKFLSNYNNTKGTPITRDNYSDLMQ